MVRASVRGLWVGGVGGVVALVVGRLVGIYKTHHCTKSVTINPAKLAAHIPSSPVPAT